jgi:NADH-quinone oxidoreductase subunit M
METPGCYCLTTLPKLLFSPLLGVIFLVVFPAKFARAIASLSSLLTLVMAILLLCKFSPQDGMQFTVAKSWLPELGVRFVLGVDGISLPLIILLAALVSIVLISACETERPRGYFGGILMLELGALGCFMALEGITFFVFWELVLVALFMLISGWGREGAGKAAMGFLLYCGLGSLLMLAAMIYIGVFAARALIGVPTFQFSDWQLLSFTFGEELWLLSAFLVAFLVKVPVFPLHTWLPPVISRAPREVSILLVGALFQMGLYGVMRVCVTVFPGSFAAIAPLLAVLGVIGVIYGGLVAWVQTDVKNLIAYSSVGHLGLILFGLASVNIYSVSGAVLQMINHGLAAAAVFFALSFLFKQCKTSEISDFGGLSAITPLLATVTLVFVLSYIGLPTTGGFVGEFVLMLGGFKFSPRLMFVAVTGVVIGAVYMLSVYRRMFYGHHVSGDGKEIHDLVQWERLLLIPFVIAVFVLGLFPRPLMETVQPAVKKLLIGFEAELGRGDPIAEILQKSERSHG